MNSTHSDAGYIYIHFAIWTREQPWAQGQTVQTGLLPSCSSQQRSSEADDLHTWKRWVRACQHTSHLPRPPWPPMPGHSLAQATLHSLLWLFCNRHEPTHLHPSRHWPRPPSLLPLMETLDQGDSGHRWVQIDDVVIGLPVSPLTLVHHSLGPRLNGPENHQHPLVAGNHCSVVGTKTSYMGSVCTADPVGKALPVYCGQASVFFF